MKVASFYRFVDVASPRELRGALRARCADADLLGTILVAAEGVNGTLAGSEAGIRDVLEFLGNTIGGGAALDARWTEAESAPFRRLRVKVKNEIVTLGRPDIRPQRRTGEHVDIDRWHALLDDPQTLVIDTRNHYEIEVGTFPQAIDPGTDSFRQFSRFAERLAAGERDRPVAMFCTGGIRCEKASALLIELGFDEVYQLQGGVLRYLDEVENENNRWNGECFVFDTRVAVDRDLSEGGYVQCHACRRPLSSEDLAAPEYREGVSCPRCVHELDADRAERLEERRRQVELARSRGARHIGAKQQ